MRRVLPLVVLAVAWAAAVSPAGLAAQGGATTAQGAAGGGQRRAQPPRAQRAGEEPPKGTSAIRGFVVAADTGAPLRRVQVRAFSAESRDTRVTTTDDQGRFELKELVGGRYTITASKGGFVTLQYGQRRPNEQGTPLVVAEGQALEKVVIGLPRGSVIAGRIVDEFGEPAVGAQVSALRMRAGSSRRRALGGFGGGMTDRTDDQGSFRLFGLMPGEYLVSASMRGEDGPFSAGRGDDGAMGYASTYYPGTPSSAEAQRISVAAGEEAGGVVFALSPTRLVRIQGRVVTSEGAPAAGVVVLARPEDGLGGPPRGGDMRGGPVRDGGAFEIAGVSPGSYSLEVQPRNGPEGEFARLRVTVGSSDLAGVLITTGAGTTLSGQVVTDEGTPPPFTATAVRVMLAPVGDSPIRMPGRPPRVNDDFTFEIRGLADPALLRVSAPEGWTLKAVELAGEDVTDSPIDATAGDVRGVRVVLTRRISDLSGTVTDARGAPVVDAVVVIFADDETRWIENSRFVRSGRPDHQGLYRFRALPPARYHVAVVPSVEDGDLGDPEFLNSLRASARSVTIGEGETKSFDLRTR